MSINNFFNYFNNINNSTYYHLNKKYITHDVIDNIFNNKDIIEISKNINFEPNLSKKQLIN